MSCFKWGLGISNAHGDVDYLCLLVCLQAEVDITRAQHTTERGTEQSCFPDLEDVDKRSIPRCDRLLFEVVQSRSQKTPFADVVEIFDYFGDILWIPTKSAGSPSNPVAKYDG